MKKNLLLALGLSCVFSFAKAQSSCDLFSSEAAAQTAVKVTAKNLTPESENRYDVSWLDKAVKGKRMVMIGESHWMTSVHKTAKSIVFHLNEKDSFPVLIREIPFSVTPFFNAYLNCETGCEELEGIIKPYVGSQEEQDFLKELKAWNAAHPDKKITLVCSDFEQGFQFPFRNVFHPLFTQQGHANFRQRLISMGDNLDMVTQYMDSLMALTPAGYHLDGKPYVNKEFAEKVYDNLKSYFAAQVNLQKAMAAGKTEGEAFEEFSKVRSASIKKNLTADDRFGRLLTENKSILWGGAAHTRKYALDAADKGVYEGSFLSTEFEPTKGKVLSVKVMAMSYDIPTAYYTGETYKNGTTQFEQLVEAYKNCNAEQQANTYKMVEETTPLTDAIYTSFKANSNQPVWLEGNKQMAKLLKKSPDLKEDNQLKSFYAYDYVVVMPYTTLFTRLD